MDTVFKSLYFREPVLHYVCPPICENIFSSSGGPVIVLNSQDHLGPVTGLILGGVGDFRLRWSVYPGAVCYTVYMSPEQNGTYVVVAECIPNPEFDITDIPDGTWIIITAITPEGETPFGSPLEIFKYPAQCPHFDPPSPDLSVVAAIGDSLALGPFIVNEGLGFGLVNYLWFKDSVFVEDTTFTTKDILVLTDIDSTDAGLYTLEVSVSSDPLGQCPAIVSDAINLQVCPGIVPPLPELNINAGIGDDVDLGPFNVDEASCAGGVTYEWYKDNVLYQDTTGTTQGALSIPNAQTTDSGDYTLHISCPSLGCDPVVSDIVEVNVGTCGTTPSDLKDVVWTPTQNDACASASLSEYGSPPPDQAGLFSLTMSGGCGSNPSTVLEGYFCNNTASDINVAVNLQVTAMTGSLSLWSSFQLRSYVDGGAPVDVATWNLQPALNDSLTNIIPVPPGVHFLQIVIVGSVTPTPTFTISGSLFALTV